jgi:predicted PurR-regulated permease PerM
LPTDFHSSSRRRVNPDAPAAAARPAEGPPAAETTEQPYDVWTHVLTALTILTVLASVFAIQWARPVLVPILLGILISYALDPIVRRLVSWRVPRGLAAVVVFLATLAMIATLAYSLSHQLAAAADRLPAAAQEFREAIEERFRGEPGAVAKVQQAANELQKLSGAEAGTPPAAQVQTVAIQKTPFDFGAYLWQSSLSLTTFAADMVVVLFIALYLLLAGDTFRRRFVEIAGPTLTRKRITLQILDAVDLQISRYLFVRLLISIIVGVGTFVAFWAIGLSQPAVWGLAAGVLNVIPYLGPAAVAVAASLAAFIEFHTFSMVALTGALAVAVACIEAYAITPWLTSRTAEMNPAAVFIGLVFWGWVWGVPGLFLAVPIIMVLKSVGDHVEALQPLATLLKR